MKWRIREAGQSSHLVPKIRTRGALPLLPMCVRSVHRDNTIFTFTFTYTSYYLRLSQRFSLEPKLIPKYGVIIEVARQYCVEQSSKKAGCLKDSSLFLALRENVEKRTV